MRAETEQAGTTDRAPQPCDLVFRRRGYNFCLRCGWLFFEHEGFGTVVQEQP